MTVFGGIERETRRQLAEILRQSKGSFTVEEASGILSLPRLNTAKLMAQWTEQGWLKRIRRGLYMAIPLEANTSQGTIQDPWLTAAKIFEPCYIGGWSAAEHWELTEQLFRTVIVMTTKPIGKRRQVISGIEFWLKKISGQDFFGTKTVWREQTKVQVSNPTKTIVDLLNDPAVGGGARMVEAILAAYLASSGKDLSLLLDYAGRMKNQAIFKRLGYLLERSGFQDSSILEKVKNSLSQGNAALDPSLPKEQLVTRWKLWIPKSWRDRIG